MDETSSYGIKTLNIPIKDDNTSAIALTKSQVFMLNLLKLNIYS